MQADMTNPLGWIMKTTKRTNIVGLTALAALCSTGAMAGVATPATTIDEVFNNQTQVGEFTVHADEPDDDDIYAFVVANDDATNSSIGNAFLWSTSLVIDEDWNDGTFVFAGAEQWTPPDTTAIANAFATLFPNFTQAIAYWETSDPNLEESVDPILDGGWQDGWFFTTEVPSSPFIVIDSGGEYIYG